MGRWAPLQVVKLCSGPLVIALLYLHIAVYEAELNYGVEVQDAPHLLEKRDDLGNGNELSPKRVALLPEKARQGQQWSVRGLFDLGVKDSLALVNLLTEEDPLGVSIEDPEEFKCPQSSQYLVSPPDYSDGGAEATFKAGGGFLYFQHLRKAGGTGFCDLAQRNMPKSEVPDYYCMPDRLGALATPPWSEASYLMGQMTKRGYRIAANEWDAFPASHLQLPGAVFATSIRDPLDRWYSQYRFEHLEHRDGTRWWSYFGRWSFGQWYERIMHDSMGNNYYTKTFCGEENTTDEIAKETMRRKGMWRQLTAKKNFYWTYAKFRYDARELWVLVPCMLCLRVHMCIIWALSPVVVPWGQDGSPACSILGIFGSSSSCINRFTLFFLQYHIISVTLCDQLYVSFFSFLSDPGRLQWSGSSLRLQWRLCAISTWC
ncbi:unnamed protein product [Chrysoparadoxa australica]